MTLDVWLAFFAACWVISLSPRIAGAIASMSGGLQFGFLRGYWNVIGLNRVSYPDPHCRCWCRRYSYGFRIGI